MSILRGVCLYVSIALVAVGCSSESKSLPARQRVKGTVTYNGQPLEGATVTFWPVPVNTKDWRSVRPIAIVGPDGSFEPNSYGEKDGAIQGEYAVTLIFRATRASPDLFHGRYADPEKPLRTITIKDGDNVLPAFELEGPQLSTSPVEDAGGQ